MIRADRADGIYLKNFTVEFSDFNNIYVLETNGFRVDTIVLALQPRVRDPLVHLRPRHLRELRRVATAATPASTRAPGPNARHGQPDAHGHVYGIEIRNCDSHHNTIGMSGTAGNGTWAHDNRFHHNATGVTTDSFAGGHPGMPQDNSKWSHNLIYSNNNNLFDDERDAYCQRHAVGGARPAEGVPDVPGAGRHRAPDRGRQRQHRRGELHLRQLAPRHDAALGARPPCAARRTPAKTYDTSANNRYLRNCMGTRPLDLDNVDFSVCEGTPDMNGVDFWWDEEEGRTASRSSPAASTPTSQFGNCWAGNLGLRRPGRTRATRPRCCCRPARGWTSSGPGNSRSRRRSCRARRGTRSTTRTRPGCDWFTTPPEPSRPAGRSLTAVSVGAWTPHALLSRRCSCSPRPLPSRPAAATTGAAREQLAWLDTPTVIVPPTLKTRSHPARRRAQRLRRSPARRGVEGARVRQPGPPPEGLRHVRRGLPALAVSAHAGPGHPARLRARAAREDRHDRVRQDRPDDRLVARAARPPHGRAHRLRARFAADPARGRGSPATASF